MSDWKYNPFLRHGVPVTDEQWERLRATATDADRRAVSLVLLDFCDHVLKYWTDHTARQQAEKLRRKVRDWTATDSWRGTYTGEVW